MPGDWLRRMDTALGSRKAKPRADGQAEHLRQPVARAAPAPPAASVPAPDDASPHLQAPPPTDGSHSVPPSDDPRVGSAPATGVVASVPDAVSRPAGSASRPPHGKRIRADSQPSDPPRHSGSPARTEAAKSAAQLVFASWLAYKLELGRELKMVPRQWELVDYFGDGSWELRRFPFDALQSIALQGESPLPRLEIRIAPEGSETAEVIIAIAASRSDDRETPRLCLLHAGGFSELEPAMKEILPRLLSLWAKCSMEGDFSPLLDWALENDKSQTAGGD